MEKILDITKLINSLGKNLDKPNGWQLKPHEATQSQQSFNSTVLHLTKVSPSHHFHLWISMQSQLFKCTAFSYLFKKVNQHFPTEKKNQFPLWRIVFKCTETANRWSTEDWVFFTTKEKNSWTCQERKHFGSFRLNEPVIPLQSLVLSSYGTWYNNNWNSLWERQLSHNSTDIKCSGWRVKKNYYLGNVGRCESRFMFVSL